MGECSELTVGVGGGGVAPPPRQSVAHPAGSPWRVALLRCPLPFHRLMLIVIEHRFTVKPPESRSRRREARSAGQGVAPFDAPELRPTCDPAGRKSPLPAPPACPSASHTRRRRAAELRCNG